MYYDLHVKRLTYILVATVSDAYIYILFNIFYFDYYFKSSRAAMAQACDCKRDRLWIRFLLEETKF